MEKMDELQMMSGMECSEEESVGESEANEVWESEDQNQMDYEQELVEEVSLETFETGSSEKSNQELADIIQSYGAKKQQLEEIMKNQVDNIVELQNTCEKITYTLEQLPGLREQNAQRFDLVLKDVRDMRQKQCELNELIDYTVQIYDESLAFLFSVKDGFAIQKKLNHERCTVFKLDWDDFPSAGNAAVSSIDKRIKLKRDYCWLINNHLAEVTKCENLIEELNIKIDKTFKEANELNEKLLEYENDFKMSAENALKLKNNLQLENSSFAIELDEVKIRESEASGKVAILLQRIDKASSDLETFSTNNNKMLNEIASSKEKLDQLSNDKKLTESVKMSLLSTNIELKTQINTLSESLSGLSRCRNMVNSIEEEVKSLEAQLDCQTRRASELEKLCSDMENMIEHIDKSTRDILSRAHSLEKEYSKITPDVASLRKTHSCKRMELVNMEKKRTEEISKLKSAISEMNQQLFVSYEKFEECRKNFIALQSAKESKRETIKEKLASIAEKEHSMKSLNEELEECKVEWNDLNDKRQKSLELANLVKKLDIELAEGRKEIMKINDNFSKHFLKLNEVNNRKMEETVREMENTKQEYRAKLEEETGKGSKLETEYKSLQAVAGKFNSLLKDATQQAEFFSCEQSLLSTFAKWVFEEEPIVHSSLEEPAEEPWVTSTSGQFPIDGSVNEAEDESWSFINQWQTEGSLSGPEPTLAFQFTVS